MGAEITALSDGTYAQRTTAPQSDQSGFGIGSQAAPGAGVVIATHTPPAGNNGAMHEVEITTWLAAGAPAAADLNNMAFKFGGGTITAIPVANVLNTPMKTKFYWKAATGTPMAVIAVGAATAGVTYAAMISATKLVS